MRYLTVCTGLLLGGLAAAGDVAELYSADLAVATREETERAERFRTGIGQVLGRIVRTEDLSSGAVRPLSSQPEKFILQYEYTGGEGDLRLHVDFDEAQIKETLRQRGVQVWGRERPEVLVWLAIEDTGPARMLEQDSLPDLQDTLRGLAIQTGLPVKWPLLDLEDLRGLPAADIVAGNAERIRRASLRYGTPVVLTGLLRRQKANDYGADWCLYLPTREDRWKAGPVSLAEALRSGLTGLYARLARESVPRDSKSASLQLRVLGIDSLDDLNGVAAYLGRLSPVTRVEWLAVGNGDASFKVQVIGGSALLEQTLAMGNRLRREPESTPGLTFRLLR